MVPQSMPIGTVASPSPAVSPAYIQTYVGSIQQSKATTVIKAHKKAHRNMLK